MSDAEARLSREIEALKRRLARMERSASAKECMILETNEEEKLFSTGPVVLFRWRSGDNWPVELVSPNVEAVLGYAPAEFIDGTVQYSEIVVPEDKDRAVQEISEHIAEGSEHFQHLPYRVKRKDGRIVWLLDNTVLLRDDEGVVTHCVGYVQDITAQVEAEERWRFALEGSRDGLWDWDASTNKVYYSEQWKRMLGHEPDEIGDGMEEWRSRVHPDDLEQVMANLTAHLDGTTGYYENIHRVKCKDGSWKWILDRGKIVSRDTRGAPLRVIGTHTDLSEQIEAQKELEKARQHVADILDSTTDAFFVLDTDFNITFLNRRAESVLGVKQADVLGSKLWQVFPKARETVFFEEFRRAMREQEVAEFEGFFQPFDAWFEVHAYPTPESLSVYFRDITGRKRLEQEREQIFNLSLDMICVAGFDGKLKKTNPAWQRTLGWSEKDLTTTPWLDFVHPDDKETTIETGARLLEGKDVVQFQNRWRCKDGSYRWLSWSSVPNVEQELIYAVVRDVTEQKHLEDELTRLAHTDTLTGIDNRRCFMEKAQAEWQRFKRYGHPFSTVMIDLDHFKQVNDDYGHEGGDEVLRSLAESVSGKLRENDVFGRIGGEEFSLILPETDSEEALLVAERIRVDREGETVPYAGEALRVTLSVGVATAQATDTNFEEVLRRSDKALYQAKKEGRNKVVMG